MTSTDGRQERAVAVKVRAEGEGAKDEQSEPAQCAHAALDRAQNGSDSRSGESFEDYCAREDESAVDNDRREERRRGGGGRRTKGRLFALSKRSS